MLDEHIAPKGFGVMPYLHLLNLRVPTYTVFMILAFAAAFLCYKLTATKMDKQKSRYRLLIVLYALVGGLIGAKLPILIYNWPVLFKYPDNLALLLSGKTIVGGLIGGFLAVTLLKKSLGLTIKTGNDIAAPAALGMAIGRLGCFFGGCCYGIESPKALGIDFGDGIPRFPTQLYELVFDFGMFAIFLFLKRKKELRPGILFRVLLNAYLTFRFFIEFIRESDRAFLGLSYYQLICFFCVVFINRKSILLLFKRGSGFTKNKADVKELL